MRVHICTVAGHDRRAHRIRLTAAAVALKGPAIAAARGVNARSVSRLAAIDPATFLEVLHEVAADFGAPSSDTPDD